jgi:uncharacterized tellurite resistance protein B-like protein
MFERLRTLLDRLAGTGDTADLSEDETRIAAAALLVHVAAVDGRILPEERERMRVLLGERFALDTETTEALLVLADARDREAGGIAGFTDVLRRQLDPAGKQALVGMLMDVARADGRVHEFEENTVQRVAELIGAARG